MDLFATAAQIKQQRRIPPPILDLTEEESDIADTWPTEPPASPAKANPPNYQEQERSPDQQLAKSSRQGRGANIPLDAMENFTAALPWIKQHIDELTAAGWTKADIFSRGRFRWPCGKWGVAWLSPWGKPGLAVAIDERGRICFLWDLPNGKRVRQTATRPAK